MRLFHYLNDDGDPPWEWVISRICEEFGVLPTQAIKELDKDPERLVYRIITLRAFARSKSHVDNAKKFSDIKMDRMVEKVLEIDLEEAATEIKG